MTLAIFCLEDPFLPASGYQIPIYYRIKYYDFTRCVVFIHRQNQDPPRIYKHDFFGKEITVVELRLFFPTNMVQKAYKFLIKKIPFFATARSVNFNSIIDNHFSDESAVIYFEGEKFANISLDHGDTHLKILSVNDSLSLAYEEEFKYRIHKSVRVKLFRYLNYLRVLQFEKVNYFQFDRCQVVSHIDANYLSELNRNISTSVHNIGVDHHFFSPNKRKEQDIQKYNLLIVGNLIGGNLSYTENFIESVWSVYKKTYGDHNLKIVSRTLPRHWSNDYTRNNNIEVLRDVKSLPEVYEACDVVVSPVLKKCGMQNKILEGMSMGKTVIGYKPSFEGISFGENGVEYLAVKDSFEFIDILSNLVSRAHQRESIGAKARAMILKNYDWSILINKQKDKNLENSDSRN